MAFVVALILGFIFLDGWMRYALIAGGALIELAEIAGWLRWRNVRATTGVEGLVGMTGGGLSDCAPEGQVRVKGQRWKAHRREGGEAGTKVRVDSVEGLRLDVSAAYASGEVA